MNQPRIMGEARLSSHPSQNPGEKTWTCPVCGTIAPLPCGHGWYARRRCACERQADEAQQRRRIPATLAEALYQAQQDQTYSWLGHTATEQRYLQQRFTTFVRERQADAFDCAFQFALHPQGVLALSGSYGLGKTHLLAAIANAFHDAGHLCLFASVVVLFDAIAGRIGRDQDYHSLIRRAILTPLLLLDDLDKPKPSAFRQEILYQIIDGRSNAGRPLAFSANSSLGELDHWIGGATRSRLMMGLLPVSMTGPDFRMLSPDTQ